MTLAPDARALLDFWFSDAARPHWFGATAEFDRELAQRFGALHRRAAAGALDDWAGTADGALALVLLLDQCSRNLHRGRAEAYASDAHARRIARDAIAQGFDHQLESEGRAFLYLPFMHSESLEDQEYSVRLFVEAGLDNARYALHHRDIIRRFGRFPHRNGALGRASTAEERAYLASDEAFRG